MTCSTTYVISPLEMSDIVKSNEDMVFEIQYTKDVSFKTLCCWCHVYL